MTTKMFNKYETDDRGYSFTAPYNAPEGFSDNDCPQCGYPVKGEGEFATGVKIAYPEIDYEYQPFETECLKNIWAICTNCNWDEYS